MEHIKQFLESSTIHGLNYISSTRKWSSFLWICIVIAGFSGAFYIISQSFLTWQESPIITTVDVLPMSQIKFPKVTVCPPRGTYTSLNYDIMLAEKITLDKNNL